MNDFQYIQTAIDAASRLSSLLKQRNRRIVFAESCTAGLSSAMFISTAGVSEWLCGSAVTYREQTKTAWLRVSAELIAAHTAVSRQVTEAMASGVLVATPESDVAVAITGHLGPDAPADLDGLIYVSVAQRLDGQVGSPVTTERRLCTQARLERQFEAATLALDTAAEVLR